MEMWSPFQPTWSSMLAVVRSAQRSAVARAACAKPVLAPVSIAGSPRLALATGRRSFGSASVPARSVFGWLKDTLGMGGGDKSAAVDKDAKEGEPAKDKPKLGEPAVSFQAFSKLYQSPMSGLASRAMLGALGGNASESNVANYQAKFSGLSSKINDVLTDDERKRADRLSNESVRRLASAIQVPVKDVEETMLFYGMAVAMQEEIADAKKLGKFATPKTPSEMQSLMQRAARRHHMKKHERIVQEIDETKLLSKLPPKTSKRR